MIVVDASVLAPALGDDGATARRRLSNELLADPELVDLETTSVLRRLVRAGSISIARPGEPRVSGEQGHPQQLADAT